MPQSAARSSDFVPSAGWSRPSHDPLLLAIVEQCSCAGTLLVVQGVIQSALLKAVANLPDCLG